MAENTVEALVENEIPSTAGMTTKVVKGSIWTLAGQVFSLFVSLFTTHFVIRLLGAEAYGVYILIGLIPVYFSVADFGMGIGSTKFGSEAFARGAKEDEAKVVRTAALIAFLTSFPVAAGLVILSYPLIVWLNVPEYLQNEANIALKISAVTFVLSFLGNIFNTPQLSRLRMDLNTYVNIGFRLLGLAAIPIVVYLGGGIIGAAAVLMAVSLLTLLGHLFVSGALLNELFRFSIDRNIAKPLLKFGGSLVMAGIAATLLSNLEKGVLAYAASVEALAYYSVAYTFASMATMFSNAMIQSLLPAFSQLTSPEKKLELDKLFSRSLRINIIILLPSIAFLFVIAKPFFTIWAGENYGIESTLPFYILLFGLFFNLTAYIPHSIIMASGRSDIFAKLYWIELFPHILAIAILTYRFGAVGAALAWSLRVIVDAAIIIWLSVKVNGVSLNIFNGNGKLIFFSILILAVPVSVAVLIDNYSVWLLFLTPVCFAFYFLIVWKKLIESNEKLMLTDRFHAIFAG